MKAKQFLKQLDKCATEFTFPMLDDGDIYPVDQRLQIFRDAPKYSLAILAEA